MNKVHNSEELLFKDGCSLGFERLDEHQKLKQGPCYQVHNENHAEMMPKYTFDVNMLELLF